MPKVAMLKALFRARKRSSGRSKGGEPGCGVRPGSKLEEEEEEEVGNLNRRRVEEAEKAQRLREWRGRVRKARKEEEVEELVAVGQVWLAASAG